MKPYLLVDFGSTYTKLTAVDLDGEYIIGTSKAPTTVETNVLDGYDKAFKRLINDHPEIKEISGISACSSAAGGLKMAAIGLVEELTVEAAKRACLGAGAIVKLVFSHHMTKREAKKLKEADIDIILLAGGTDGGNKECIIQITNFMEQLFPEKSLNNYMWEHLASTLIGENNDQTFNIYNVVSVGFI